MSITDDTTRHPDYWGKHRKPAAAVLPDPEPEPEPAPRTERTDLEIIAAWVASLTYANMKALSAAILGDGATPEAVIEHSDKLNAWSERTKVPL